jgi:hypothetical protein
MVDPTSRSGGNSRAGGGARSISLLRLVEAGKAIVAIVDIEDPHARRQAGTDRDVVFVTAAKPSADRRRIGRRNPRGVAGSLVGNLQGNTAKPSAAYSSAAVSTSVCEGSRSAISGGVTLCSQPAFEIIGMVGYAPAQVMKARRKRRGFGQKSAALARSTALATKRYRSWRSRDWIKVNNPNSPAMIRAREAEWRC